MYAPKGTVLYVEDNNENRSLVRRVLSWEGYDMREASDATQALDQLRAGDVDLILMDINMPMTDGYTLTAHIKALPAYADVPIIAITANALHGDRERSLQAGCDGYIQKPIDIDTLAGQLARFAPRRPSV
jgi:two-component system cell cycle response regulator DivK